MCRLSSRRNTLGATSAKNPCQGFELSIIIREKRCLPLSFCLSLSPFHPFLVRGDVATKIVYARSPRVFPRALRREFLFPLKDGTNERIIHPRTSSLFSLFFSLFPSRNEGFLDNRFAGERERETEREREREREGGRACRAKLRVTNVRGKILFFASGFIRER